MMSYLNLGNQSSSPLSATHHRPLHRKRGATVTLLCVILVPLFACGSSSKKSHYEQAMGKQERCCQGLQDDRQRSECVDSIIRIDDASTENSDVNEATFQCVEKNFVCDKSTGKATSEASQAALDCITDLGQ